MTSCKDLLKSYPIWISDIYCKGCDQDLNSSGFRTGCRPPDSKPLMVWTVQKLDANYHTNLLLY